MARRPQPNSIYRIAKEVGVSAATVSRAMNNRTGVSEEVRTKVAQLLAKYQFTPNYPSSRRTRIAFLTGEDNSGYILRALSGILEYARQHELDVNLIFHNGDSGTKLLQTIRDQQCSAIIAGPGDGFKKLSEELIRSTLPVVFLDTAVDDPRLGYIDNDSYSGSAAATRHLLDQGHRKIGYLLHYDNPTTGVAFDHLQRFKGYEDTMRKAGVSIDTAWVVRSPMAKNTKRGTAGITAMEELLRQAPELTAVMAVDDSMALGALTVIHKSGRKIPEDISVIGFDNYDDTENWFPALTTVDHPIEQAGLLAAENIDMAVRNPGAWTPPSVTLPTRLIVRESTGPVHG